MPTLHLDIVSTKEEIYSGSINSVFAPVTTGEIGVFPGHMAFLAILKPGEVCVHTENDEESIFVAGGIIEVQPTVVTIFSDTVMRAHDIDETKVLEAQQRAQSIIDDASTDQDLTTTHAALAIAIAQLQILSKMRAK